MKSLRILTIGGGTGTHMLLSGLKKYVPEVELSAIVTVADDGGSTGRLRDAFGYLPVGDFRMALTALAADTASESLLRDLFQYRFTKGDGLVGHNFGNLLLVALTDMLGSEEQAIIAAGKLLHTCGTVIPVTGEKLKLHARYNDGVIVKGESFIDGSSHGVHPDLRVEEMWVEPKVPASRFARDAINEADYLILGPGDLYTSTIANLVVPGVREAIVTADAKIIVIGSLMTKAGQTGGMTANEFVTELERYAGRKADYILLNNQTLPPEVLQIYAEEGEYPIRNDLDKTPNIVYADLLQPGRVHKSSSDLLKRSLLRHDSTKTADAIMNIIRGN